MSEHASIETALKANSTKEDASATGTLKSSRSAQNLFTKRMISKSSTMQNKNYKVTCEVPQVERIVIHSVLKNPIKCGS